MITGILINLNSVIKIKGAVIISGSPGLKNDVARKIRMVKDDSRSHSLINHGLQIFIDTWYSGELWKRLLLGLSPISHFYALLNVHRWLVSLVIA